MVTAASADSDSWTNFKCKKQCLLEDFATKKQRQIALGKGTTNSNLFRDRQDRKNKIDVSEFNHVIGHNSDQLYVDVEGMTPYSTLVDYLLKYGFMPTVVPELKSITIGGALVGIGIESSSFRYGLVHETAEEIEVLTGSGEIIIARPDNEYSDLFFALPNSYGTLGYALRVRIKIVKVEPFVELKYLHFSDANEYYTSMQQICHENKTTTGLDFVEGIVYSEKKYVIALAKFCKDTKKTSNYKFMRPYYKSILKRDRDYLTTYDYIWRWDADWFWCSKIFGMQNKFLRFILGKWMLKSTSYNKIRYFLGKRPRLQNLLKKLGPRCEFVIQDVCVPINRAAEFLDFFQKEIGITPVWNCPIISYNPQHHYTMFNLSPDIMFVNFGFWDKVTSSKPEGYYNSLIESKVEEFAGHKSLYSDSFYSEDEFWNIYDKPAYSTLKLKYDPNSILSDLYTKCCVSS